MAASSPTSSLLRCAKEAVKLVQMHEHLYENAEMRQRVEEDEYMLFARWLYTQGAINEGEE